MQTSSMIRIAGALAALAAGCGPSRVTLPTPPQQLQDLAAIYENPTGTVPVESIAAARAEAQRRATDAGRGPNDFVTQLLIAVRQRLDEAGLSSDPSSQANSHSPKVKGYIDIQRTCRGWDPAQTTPNPADGELKITALFEDRTLADGLWGSGTMCKGRVDVTENRSLNVYLDGTLGILLEGSAPTKVSEARFLAAFAGAVGTDTSRDMLAFDFRVLFPQVEVRVPVDDGDVIASVGAGGIMFRGVNGTFTCPLTETTCTMAGSIESRVGGK